MSVKAEKMSDKITLSFLTKFIKSYNGDVESLPAFLTNCDNAMSLASSDQRSVLCKFIFSQLEGKAQIACSLKTFSDWEELKTFLKSTFGEKKHATHLLSDLRNCRQQSNEEVTKYALRVESILTKIQSDIQYSCKNPLELPGRIAAMEDVALNSFLLGLNNSISTIVRCRNPSSLSDAVQYATDEEKLFNLSRSQSRPQKQCTVCNKIGHNSSECFRNKKHSQPSFHVNSNPNSHSNSNNASNSFNSNHSNSNNPNFNNLNKSCNYCKNIGHTIYECRKRKYNMQRRQNADFVQRDNPTRNSAPVHACEFENACEPTDNEDNLN